MDDRVKTDDGEDNFGPALTLIAYGVLLFCVCGLGLLLEWFSVTTALIAYGIGAFSPVLVLAAVGAVMSHRRARFAQPHRRPRHHA